MAAPPHDLDTGRESDNLIRVRSLSATEAARGFADLLDQIEAGGESVLIMRRGRAVATIGPAPTSTWAGLLATLDGLPADDAWADDLEAVRSAAAPADLGDPWER